MGFLGLCPGDKKLVWFGRKQAMKFQVKSYNKQAWISVVQRTRFKKTQKIKK